MRPTRRRDRLTVEAALDAFIARKRGQRLSHSWLYKFSLMQRELVNFARGRGLTYIDEFSDDELGPAQSILEGRTHHRPKTTGTLALVFFVLRA